MEVVPAHAYTMRMRMRDHDYKILRAPVEQARARCAYQVRRLPRNSNLRSHRYHHHAPCHVLVSVPCNDFGMPGFSRCGSFKPTSILTVFIAGSFRVVDGVDSGGMDG